MSIVILVSGRGSNMEAILREGLPVSAVISNRADAAGLAIAAARGIATEVVPHRDYPDRESFDAALAQAVARHDPRAVALAGFMRVLTPVFVNRFADRLLNIHPSLLPSFPGLDTHERAIRAGVKLHGCTVHFVTPELDHGPIVIQAAVSVRPGDTAGSLAARVLKCEHVVFPRALRWLIDGRLVVSEGCVRVEGGMDDTGEQLLWNADA